MQSETHQNTDSAPDTSAFNAVGIDAVLGEFEKALNDELNFRIIGRYGNISVSRTLGLPLNGMGIGSVRIKMDYSPEGVIASKLDADELTEAASLIRGSVNNKGISIVIRISYEKVLANYLNPRAAQEVCNRLLMAVVNVCETSKNPFDMTGITG